MLTLAKFVFFPYPCFLSYARLMLIMPECSYILTPSHIIDLFFIPYRPGKTWDVRAHCSIDDRGHSGRDDRGVAGWGWQDGRSMDDRLVVWGRYSRT